MGGFVLWGKKAECDEFAPDQFFFRAKYFLDWAEDTARYAFEFTSLPCVNYGRAEEEKGVDLNHLKRHES
ncbi:MAG: hypothetical protein EBT07_17505 [Actinobacteria bacterium]|nr:hypothetical protein [Actinomycetota bacterium]